MMRLPVPRNNAENPIAAPPAVTPDRSSASRSRSAILSSIIDRKGHPAPRCTVAIVGLVFAPAVVMLMADIG
jgi:hypothetical protein